MTYEIRSIVSEDLPILEAYYKTQIISDFGPELSSDFNFKNLELAAQKLYSRDLSPKTMGWIIQSSKHIDAAVVATEVDSSYGARFGIIHTLKDCGNPDIMSELINRIATTAREYGWKVLRTRIPINTYPDLPVFFKNWEYHGFIVRKKVVGYDYGELIAPKVSNSVFQIRVAQESDNNFIIDLLVKALWNGCSDKERKFATTNSFLLAAKKIYIASISEQMSVLIAEINGERIAHITANFSFVSELSGQREPTIHDIFVLPQYRNMGISRLLSQCIENNAANCGVDYLYGTVISFSSSKVDYVTQKLPGWTPRERIIFKVLE